MEDNAAEDDDIDFSMISPGNEKQKQIDFSVNELLTNPPPQQSSQKPQQQVNRTKTVVNQQAEPEGSFLRDLGKMEKQISYESNLYDIYEPSQQFGEFTKTVQARQEDTCTRTINNLNNLTKLCQKYGDEDLKYLILDFAQEKAIIDLKTKQSFQDYFQGQILKTKKIASVIDKQQFSRNKIISDIIHTTPSHKIKKVFNKQQKNIQNIKKPNSPVALLKTKSQSKNFIENQLKTTKTTIQSSKSKSKSKQSKNRLGNKQKSKKKQGENKFFKRQKTQAFSQYFGFAQELKSLAVKPKSNLSKSKSKLNSKSKQRSKSKKIVFSKKNVNSYH